MKELPSGWVDTSLAEASNDISYGFTTSATTIGDRPKFLRITDVQDYSVDWSTVPFCHEEPPSKFDLASGDIVIARTGATTGKSYLISEVPERAVFASYLIRVRASACISPLFLSKFMQSPEYWSQITVVSKGTAQPGANASILGGLKIPLPPLPEQRRIVRKLDTLTARTTTARTHLSAIEKLVERYRQRMIVAAFSGRLTRTDRTYVAYDKEGLWDIPTDWQWRTIEDVAKIQPCLTPVSEIRDLPHIAPDNVEKNTGKLLGSVDV